MLFLSSWFHRQNLIIACAIECHIGDISTNGTTEECEGANYCWKYELCENKCKTGRGCGGERSDSGNYDIYARYFGALVDSCLTKNVKIGGVSGKLTGCACSTDLCNAGFTIGKPDDTMILSFFICMLSLMI